MDLDSSGFEQLQGKLARMATQGGREASKKGMRAAVKLRAKAVREKAPVKDPASKWFPETALPSGAIKADIKTSVKDGPTPDEVDGLVYPGKETAHVQYFVENGHRLVVGGYSKVSDDGKVSGPGRQVAFIEPNPFWRPAEEETAQAAIDAYIEVAGQDIQKQIDQE